MHGRRLERVWRALADPTRRRLIDLLSEEATTTGDLAAAFPRLSRFAVMKHLDVLERAGLVLARRQGRQVWNHLNAVPLREVYERWVGKHESATAAALLRLKRHVEKESSESPTAPGDSKSPPEFHAPWFEQHEFIQQAREPSGPPTPAEMRGSTRSGTRTRALAGASVFMHADAATVWHLLTDPSASRAWQSCVRFEEPPREGATCVMILSTHEATGPNRIAHVREVVARQVVRIADADSDLAFRLRATPEGTHVEMSCASQRSPDLSAAMEALVRLHEHAERGWSTS